MPERKRNFAIDVCPETKAKAGKTVIFYLGLDNSGLKSVHGIYSESQEELTSCETEDHDWLGGYYHLLGSCL